MLLKILFDYLKAYRYFLYELEPEPEPRVKNGPALQHCLPMIKRDKNGHTEILCASKS